MKPSVSCIITTYGRDVKIVKRALDSILAQTFKDFEVIIVDDNRGEGSEALSDSIKSLEDESRGIRVIKTENGHGAQYARNTGIMKSSGEFVAFLDDDDRWLPEKLEKQVKLLREDTECGMCYTDGYRVDEERAPGKRELIHDNFFNPALTYRELLHEDRIGSTSQAMIRRSVFDTVGLFDTDMPARQDYEMWLRISRSYKVAGIPEGLYLYNTGADQGKITRSWKKNVEAHLLLGKKYGEDIRGDRKAKFNVIFHLAHYYRLGGLKMKALSCYIRSFFISPSSFFKQANYLFDKLFNRR